MIEHENCISIIRNEKISRPTFVIRHRSLETSLEKFESLNCEILYPVKTNPDDYILSYLIERGIDSFDVASIGEVEKISGLSKKYNKELQMYFMHPVKPRDAIREAYFDYGIRHFSLDSHKELEKILEETNNAEDLNLHVRISIPNSYSEINLSEKFGINLQESHSLLERTKKNSKKVGICFHVGSQCMHPDAYKHAIQLTSNIANEIGIDYFNIGGGFPSIYPGLSPTTMDEFFSVIHAGFNSLKNKSSIKFLSEPGRAIVAECMSLIVQVNLKRGNTLYINDGIYGNLFDAGFPKLVFPTRLLKEEISEDLIPFQLYGPTCDSLDKMEGPFYLPSNVEEGDYIEIGQVGSYSKSMTSEFNGFRNESRTFLVKDSPIISMYK